MMSVVSSADGPGRIARLLEDGTIRLDVATVYALLDLARGLEGIAGNRHPIPPGKSAGCKPHGKIVLRVA